MISVASFVNGINEIYNENPAYQTGHDGSDGYCDCIGMLKGSIRRNGGNASGLSGVNYAARRTITQIRRIESTSDLKVGDVVMKSRLPGESGYDLPEKYRFGGSEYNGDLTDYYHIGTVTRVYPLEITHMTSPNAKKDDKLGKWSYKGWLPQISNDEPEPKPEPEPQPVSEQAIVTAPSGSTVNLRINPSMTAKLIDKVPIGNTVTVLENGVEWSNVKWRIKTGWMMSKFLKFTDEYVTVIIPDLTEEQAEMLCAVYPQATVSRG